MRKSIYLLLPLIAALLSCSAFPESDTTDPEVCIDYETHPIGLDSRAVWMIEQSNSTAWEMLRRALSEGENTLLSPLSLNSCLAMICNGAAGPTEEAIRQFILGRAAEGEGIGLQQLNLFCGTLQHNLPQLDTSVELLSANSMWFQQGLEVEGEFSETLRDCYGAECRAVDFNSSEARQSINKWCDESTKGLIPNLLTQPTDGMACMLLNALYFRAPWASEFDKRLTRKERFALSNGEGATAEFMHRTSVEKAIDNETVSMVGLPMGKFSKYCAFFALPKEGKTLVEATVAAEAALGDRRAGTSATWEKYEVEMAIPKFKVETKPSLKQMLEQLGMAEAFEGGDYSRMFGNADVELSDVKQACSFSIDEREIEAAAVTTGEFVFTATGNDEKKTMQLRLNRPFVYGVYEVTTGTLLFVGAMERPEL